MQTAKIESKKTCLHHMEFHAGHAAIRLCCYDACVIVARTSLDLRTWDCTCSWFGIASSDSPVSPFQDEGEKKVTQIHGSTTLSLLPSNVAIQESRLLL